MARGLPEAHRLLVEAYNEAALRERTCREWFQKFKNGDFDVEDKDRNGRPKIYEDVELEEDPSQTQKELALTLEVTQQAVSHRLQSSGIIHKQGNWVPYELTPRDIERRLCMSEMLLARRKKESFLHRIFTGDEKWIQYDNPKRRKSWGLPGHGSTSTAKPNIHGKKNSCCVFDIAPSAYRLFRSIAHALSEQRFTSYEDTKNWVDLWIASKDKDFFRFGIQTLPGRWKKVVASDGQYFDQN
ncbi:Mariner Mos1 transposase [Eumeta japonica]|uniref:Mariner Mos1 transposase n=1 Tax=Eumeta variegata TaxID=151549 RepID=A0A4C2ADQ4_EUMVA|nr:Mariner Mos1 transposase [Eumeta japonica]